MSEQVPLVDYLVLDGSPHLRAHECTACGARYFDRRNGCASCFGTEFRDADVAREGEVRAFTIVAHAARNTRLRAGDVLGSGTVGSGCILEHGDGRWLQPGDVVELEIEGIGVLRNRVGPKAA